jgi:hypothetical protein
MMNNVTSWEERMARRAAERRAAQPDLHDVGHEDHHLHYEGNTVVCSCGEFRGVISVALTGDEPDPDTYACAVCGKPGATTVQ